MPKGAKFIRPRKVYVVIGTPLQTASVTGSPKAQRDAARRLTVELHAELQRLFDIAQARVG
jgi:hypothetical protein